MIRQELATRPGRPQAKASGQPWRARGRGRPRGALRAGRDRYRPGPRARGNGLLTPRIEAGERLYREGDVEIGGRVRAGSPSTASTPATCAPSATRRVARPAARAAGGRPRFARAMPSGASRAWTTCRRSRRPRRSCPPPLLAGAAAPGREVEPAGEHAWSRSTCATRSATSPTSQAGNRLQGPDAARRRRRLLQGDDRPARGDRPAARAGRDPRRRGARVHLRRRVADRLGCGFVPARKPASCRGRRSRRCTSSSTAPTACRWHADALGKGSRVIVHDDVLATGGTARAKTELVEQLGGGSWASSS